MDKSIINHFLKNDPTLHVLIEKCGEIKLSKKQELFLELCDHIISQQLSIKASAAILNRFIELFPNKKLDPKTLLKLKDQQIRDIGISWSKIKYLKDLAQKIVDKEIDLESLDKLEDEEIIQELIKVKGIGRWTAEMFLMSSLGRTDVFSYGDLGIRKAIQRIYKLDHEPTQEEAEQISKNWKPYRSYGCKILWRSLDNS